MTEIKTYTTKEQRTEMLKFYQTIPTDGEGSAVEFTYNSMDVRNDMIKLIADFDSLTSAIESQDRTIKTYEEVQQGWIESHARNYKEIESLKAITELAVKGLERIAEHDKEIGCYTSVAMVALSEIERLSHEQNS